LRGGPALLRSAGLRWLVLALVGLAIASCALRPVCVPLSEEDVARFDPPIETRGDRDLYLSVFQQRNGRWHQCKTWLSRQLFF
jgi:hypothetical protein